MQETINIINKKAKLKYFLLKKYISGLVLNESEIKSIRQKKENIDIDNKNILSITDIINIKKK